MSGDIIVGIIKDVLVGIAAITATIVAIMGLRRWKKELHGRVEFETARNLIRATYALREEIRICRSPFTSSGEFPKDYDLIKTQDDPEENGKAWAYIYKNRMKTIPTALTNFETAAIESEVLWGEELKLKTNELKSCLNTLSISIAAFIQNKYSGGQDFRDTPEFAKTVHNDIWIGRDDTNALSIKIKKAITELENEIRPHLKK